MPPASDVGNGCPAWEAEPWASRVCSAHQPAICPSSAPSLFLSGGGAWAAEETAGPCHTEPRLGPHAATLHDQGWAALPPDAELDPALSTHPPWQQPSMPLCGREQEAAGRAVVGMLAGNGGGGLSYPSPASIRSPQSNSCHAKDAFPFCGGVKASLGPARTSFLPQKKGRPFPTKPRGGGCQWGHSQGRVGIPPLPRHRD